MKCAKCNETEFIRGTHNFKIKLKKKEIVVPIETLLCKCCQTPTIDTEQMNTLRKEAANRYRKENNLLTSLQIQTYRKSLRMTQDKFAEYVRIGSSSIKRYETYYIQDKSQDELLRLKCDIEYLEKHLKLVKEKISEME